MGAEVVVGDLLDLDSMHRVIAGCETMYFGMSVSDAYLAATVNAAVVAKHHGVKAFINMCCSRWAGCRTRMISAWKTLQSNWISAVTSRSTISFKPMFRASMRWEIAMGEELSPTLHITITKLSPPIFWMATSAA